MMTSKPEQKTIFVRENDSLETVLDLFENELGREGFRKQLKFVFTKQSNNYVGYYLFLHGNQAYKIFVLPKIIDATLDESEVVRQFINYLGEFYRLDGQSGKAVESPLEIAFEHPNNDSSSQKDLDTFLYHKYSYLLKEIESFFRRHQQKHSRTVSYASQAVRHRLDLAKNIRAVDKSRVHQSRKDEYVYSDLARIAYGVIRLFLASKVVLISRESNRQKLEKQCRTLNSMLLQKFHVDRSFTLKLQMLLSLSSYRYFRGSEQTKKLYRHLLMLFGLERLFDDHDADIHYDQKGEYLFFKPEKLYEKYVFDWLNEHKGEHDIEIGQIHEQKSKSYETCTEMGDSKFYTSSEPDILIEKENTKTVIDAKWKIISGYNQISAQDILKLERDVKVHGADRAILVFCKIKHDSQIHKLKTKYNGSSQFQFEVMEIPLNLT